LRQVLFEGANQTIRACQVSVSFSIRGRLAQTPVVWGVRSRGANSRKWLLNSTQPVCAEKTVSSGYRRQVTDVWEQGPEVSQFDGISESGRLMQARLRLLRVLKGNAVDELMFTFLRSNFGDSGFVGVNKGEFGLFFFRESNDGLIFASHEYPKIIAGREQCVTAGEPLDRVVGELACVIESPTSAVFDRISALGALATAPATSATEVLQRAAHELPAPLNLLAAIDLVARNDISALPLIEEGARTAYAGYIG